MDVNKSGDDELRVLSFRIGESLHIAGATLNVMRIDTDKIQLGIEAPREMRILRGETYLALQRANREV